VASGKLELENIVKLSFQALSALFSLLYVNQEKNL
jgi:hypothetical protein